MLNKQSASRRLLLLLLSFSFFLSFNTRAQEIKIGFVNSARVLQEAPQAERARVKLQAEFEPRDKKIVLMQKALKKLEDEMNRDSAVMSETVRKKKERKLLTMKRDIKRTQEEFNEDLNLRRNEELNNLQQKVYEAIVSLAKEEHYDVILGDSVMFASKRVDITDKIIKRLSKKKHRK
ncbi:Periplasmic chaperone of outer membrane proteins Skp @ Outer membrane protein H precursor [hydrothermal vent metagenome]|uniref:Periplasmic chaperone of outer membrane proteins Skp @ Outer membrane protein H n=1 Tax=hydrothermal vent metagenome TaxID=652676 RepID=A0A3B1B8X6_9ZZZZ